MNFLFPDESRSEPVFFRQYNYPVYMPITLISDPSTLHCHACLQFYAGHMRYMQKLEKLVLQSAYHISKKEEDQL